MDGMRWNSLFSCVQPRLWPEKIKENSSGFNFDCGNVNDVDNLFNTGGDIERIKSCKLPNDMIQQLAPALDSINASSSDLNLLQRQEAVTGISTSTSTAELRTPPLINMLYSTTPLSGLMQVSNGMDGGTTIGASADSFESLDCLLSANSNTDTSVEDDDGISVLFSDCRKLWNFNSGNAMSSGESVNNEVGPSPSRRPTSLSSSKRKEEQDSYFEAAGFQLITENPSKKQRIMENHQKTTKNINFQKPKSSISGSSTIDEPDTEAIAQVKEMIYRAAVFRPVNLDREVVEKPKRKNVKISSDPQTVAARQRRERISDRIRILQRIVPGGNKMDTASMLDEAANYLKFLRSQVKALESFGHNKLDYVSSGSTSTNLPYPSLPFNSNFSMQPFFPFPKP